MSDYTERFSEQAELLAEISPAAYTTEQNTGYVSLANFHRAVIVIQCGTLTANIDVDVEEATSTAGANPQTLDNYGKDTVLYAATHSDTTTIIEVRTEELDTNDEYDCINVELNPINAQSGSIFGVQVWGLVPRYKPVATTLLAEVVD